MIEVALTCTGVVAVGFGAVPFCDFSRDEGTSKEVTDRSTISIVAGMPVWCSRVLPSIRSSAAPYRAWHLEKVKIYTFNQIKIMQHVGSLECEQARKSVVALLIVPYA